METEADGSPWGFWSVITSSLKVGEEVTALRNRENILLEAYVIDEVNTALYTIRQEDISCSRDSNNMGVLVERFERDGIMIFSRSFARVMKWNQVSWCEGLICNWVGVIMLPASRYYQELCSLVGENERTSAKGLCWLGQRRFLFRLHFGRRPGERTAEKTESSNQRA